MRPTVLTNLSGDLAVALKTEQFGIRGIRVRMLSHNGGSIDENVHPPSHNGTDFAEPSSSGDELGRYWELSGFVVELL